MATASKDLLPGAAKFDTGDFPQFLIENGAGFAVETLNYDAATDEAAIWVTTVPAYASGLSIDIFWKAASATSGTIKWEVSVMALTPDTDTASVKANSFDTSNDATDTVIGGAAGRIFKHTITLTNEDGIADGDLIHIQIARDTTDTATGDIALLLGRLYWTTT